ncbi:MAG: right-handed parallel beta-helix repeat-containing protein [Thermomicrobiales bacterium]|nr:right-handed parallel beta-helix repeat-containing protein [Thermomicrobiales bacterium]
MRIIRFAAVLAILSTLVVVAGAAPAAAADDCVIVRTPRSYQLQGDCTTDSTIFVPNGATLDGRGYTITAVNPDGGKFRGAVVQNEGSSMNITRLVVRADVGQTGCAAGNDRLAGVRFDSASGSITKSSILDINQGASGCQEGNAIEVRNPPFDGTGSNPMRVEISNNRVENYQKTGIVVNGDVIVMMYNNTVGASATQASLAANAVQIAYGAGGWVSNNTVYGNQWLGTSYWYGAAFLLYQAENLQVVNNTVLGNSDYGFAIDTSNNILLRGNYISDQGADSGVCHEYNGDCYTFDIGIGSYYSTNVQLLSNQIVNFDVQYETEDGPQRIGNDNGRSGRSGR